MKAYRIVVEIKDPIHSPIKYISPRMFLFLPFKCAYQYEQEFVAQCQVLFNTEEHTNIDNQELNVYYKQYEIHPLRDLIGRIVCAIKYFM
jgi:hypothetical protein